MKQNGRSSMNSGVRKDTSNMARTIYVDGLSDVLVDSRIASAYRYALYNGNSKSGNFRNSRGYRALKEAAYAVQRDGFKSAVKVSFVGD